MGRMQGCAQGAQEVGTLVAVELDSIEAIACHVLKDVVDGGIHKHTYTLSLERQIGGWLCYIALATRPEDKAHPVSS